MLLETRVYGATPAAAAADPDPSERIRLTYSPACVTYWMDGPCRLRSSRASLMCLTLLRVPLCLTLNPNAEGVSGLAPESASGIVKAVSLSFLRGAPRGTKSGA